MTLGISMAVIYLALPVGGALMMILTVRNMIRAVGAYRAGPARTVPGSAP